MPRIPLLSGSKVQVVTVDDDAVLLLPPPPLAPLAEVGPAVEEALRYPLSGSSLDQLVTAGGRVTVVVEPPALPFPGATDDPKRDALAALLDELDRLGMPRAHHTLLVAGGLGRRIGDRELERQLLRPERAREFHGRVVVHDAAADDDLRALGTTGAEPPRVAPALLDTDLVITLTAAETTDRGGAGVLLAACSATDIAAPAAAASLLQSSTSPSGAVAAAVEGALAATTPVIGVSLVLDHPRLTGHYAGYPWSRAEIDAAGRSPVRPILNALPGRARRRLLQRLGRDVNAVAVLAGPPSVAHAEALLRGVALRGTRLQAAVDTVVVPLPWAAHDRSGEPLNPISAAAVGLGLALRLWRDAPPLRPGGTVVLLHDFGRALGHGRQAPYRSLFDALRESREPAWIAETARAAMGDPDAIAAYRSGRAPHPLLPYAEWKACGPTLALAGRVIVAGCRDAGSARALGLVPSHNAAAALEMARGVAGGSHRVGVLLAPPYAPLLLGSDQSIPR